MDDGMTKLERFNVAHGRCPGTGVTFSEPTEADLDAEGGSGRLWISGRCDGCGATIRESADVLTMMTQFGALVEAAGIAPADLTRALESGDTAAIEALSEKIKAAPSTLLACLASIRKATTNETQN